MCRDMIQTSQALRHTVHFDLHVDFCEATKLFSGGGLRANAAQGLVDAILRKC